MQGLSNCLLVVEDCTASAFNQGSSSLHVLCHWCHQGWQLVGGWLLHQIQLCSWKQVYKHHMGFHEIQAILSILVGVMSGQTDFQVLGGIDKLWLCQVQC